MNQLQKALTEICSTHRLREKILIVPSFSQGHQITESLVKNGIPYINLRIKPITSLAHEFIDLDLARESLTFISETSVLIIIEDLFNQIRERDDSYFHNMEPKEGMVNALAETIRELRMCGLNADILNPKHFINEKKGSEIKELLRQYEVFLKEKQYVDHPEILKKALSKIKQEQNTADNSIYLFLSDIPYFPLEKEFIEALSGEKIILPHDKVQGIAYPQRCIETTIKTEESNITSNIEKLPWLFMPEKAPNNFSDKTVDIFHAVGRRNEIREVLRRIISADIKNDEVEIIYASCDDYVPLLYDVTSKSNINVTFGEGLPITFTRPGKAVLGFLSWMLSNYQAIKFRQLITSGNLDIKIDEQENGLISPAVMARIMRESPIGWGKERYILTLEKMTDSYMKKSTEITEEGEKRRDFYKQREANTRYLISMLKPILDSIPEENHQNMIALKDLCNSILDFVSQYARVSNELDGEAKTAIKEKLDEIQAITTKKLSFNDAINQIDLILREIRVGQSGTAPGFLHVSSYLNGGRSGRHHTYIIGCDAQTFPGTVIQNPVLLDEELQAISDNLVTSSEILKEKLYKIASLLSSLRGNVTLSFSSFDVLENRESFPSSILLQVHRLISGNINASYTDLMEALKLPSGYIHSGIYIDMSDFWIKSFVGEQGLRQPDASVFQCYPGLSQGKKAKEARESDTVTEYDGKLLAPDKELDPRENVTLVMSATTLEKFAKCPYLYFLYNVLKIRPLEEITLTEDTWLDGMQRGSLLHEVFNRFMKKITSKKEKPSFVKHAALIKSILEEIIQEYREEIPPPSEAIFEQEKKILLKATEVFLKTEEDRCKKYIPVFFELAFGYDDAEPELREPVTISLSPEKSFKLAGRIDRIDKIADHEYAVLDYKTGSAYGYKDNACFNEGKIIQHALYAIAAEKLLQKIEKDEKLSVKQSGYLFPTEKETGRLVIYARNDKELMQLLNALFDIVKTGIFIPSDDKDSCTYCDYKNICGESVKESAKLKFQNTENNEIHLLKKLENYE